MTYYPFDIIEQIADPFFGLPARQNRIPTPYDVRKMADELMAPRLREARYARGEAAAAAAAAEAAAIEQDRKTRPTLEEIEDDCAAQGIYFSSWLARNARRLGPGRKLHGETAETVRAKFSLTPGQWAALPDSPNPGLPAAEPGTPGLNISEGGFWQRIGADRGRPPAGTGAEAADNPGGSRR